MTITSAGYKGTVGEQQWAKMMPRVGAGLYSVNDAASFKVSIAAGTRQVSVARGGASAAGIFDESSAVETLTLASVPSGTRWDLIVLRRTWATKATTLVVIPGGSTKVLPARNSNVGVVHDQPLALARVIAGNSAVQEVVDLRCVVGDGGAVAFDKLALTYLDRVGTQIRVGDFLWTRVLNSTGSPAWVVTDETPDTGWVAVTRNAGWEWSSTSHARRIGPTIWVRLTATRKQGWSVGGNLATLAPPFRPDAAWHADSTHAAGKTEFAFNPDGRIDATQASGGATSVTLRTSFPAPRPE